MTNITVKELINARTSNVMKDKVAVPKKPELVEIYTQIPFDEYSTVEDLILTLQKLTENSNAVSELMVEPSDEGLHVFYDRLQTKQEFENTVTLCNIYNEVVERRNVEIQFNSIKLNFEKGRMTTYKPYGTTPKPLTDTSEGTEPLHE